MLDAYFSFSEGGDRAFTVEAPKIKFGWGALQEVGADAKALGMTRVALFTDPRVQHLEPVETVRKALEREGLDVAVFAEVEVEPTDRAFQAGARFAQEGRFDGFLSVGGGSCMDTAKAANLYSTWPEDLFAYVNAPIGRAQPVPGPLKPHIACPTTFGTASECTGIAICDFLELGVKSGISHAALRPSLGVLDPSALQTLPPAVRAANGLDVFSHACESVTARPFTHRPAPETPTQRPLSQGANPYSDLACLRSIRLIGEHLLPSLADPEALEPLEGLMFAGMLAGIGFGNAGCHVPHGMSYAVAGLAKELPPDGWPGDHAMVPHGTSVIVNAPAVFRKTGPACPERHLQAAEALGMDIRDVARADAGEALAQQVIHLMQQAQLPNGISGLGYTEADLPALTERAWAQQRLLVNAPLPLSEADVRDLFQGALRYW